LKQSILIAWLFLSLAAGTALAGGGPENVFLVVNSSSEASKTIANNYINWRQIPPSNVFYIDWTLGPHVTDGALFRDRILLPVVNAIDQRGLASQIDYIVYSSDFPPRINLRDVFANAQFPPGGGPDASINSTTYLAPLFLGGNVAMTSMGSNWYVPGPIEPNIQSCEKLADVPSRGFRWRYSWDRDGKKATGGRSGQRYLLSTMLAITTAGRGNTVEEVLNYLRRSIGADGTRPRGTFYFVWNKDVRSTARDKCFPAIAAQIDAEGGHAAVQMGRLPTGAKDALGIMTGTSDFDLNAEHVQILPGAICDHLTSQGGIFLPDAGQTPLTEFLRHGAAGASGAVVEPFALQAKFPLPSIHLHYLRGCSLAESFYQSVSGPFQLLIVGDPLCQPFAVFPRIKVDGVKPGDTVKGAISITPLSATPIGSYELFIDGRLTESAKPGIPLRLDSTKLPDGFHELRVVGNRADAIETQGRCILPVNVNNHESPLELKMASAARVPRLAKVKLSVRQAGAKMISIRQNNRELARVQAESGDVEIAAASLGTGPSTLQAFSEGKTAAASAPIRVLVE
jgi:hypothetical protein